LHWELLLLPSFCSLLFEADKMSAFFPLKPYLIYL
jgi:hypothetical protein